MVFGFNVYGAQMQRLIPFPSFKCNDVSDM